MELNVRIPFVRYLSPFVDLHTIHIIVSPLHWAILINSD